MGKDWFTKKGRLEGNQHTTSGCMSAVFQLFDFHHFQFALHHQVPTLKPESFLPDESITLKGVEAPRNSLEMAGPFTSFSSTMKGEEILSMPMGIQIKTRAGDLSSEFSSSPGSKTPNLVARLMGLDLLPPDICSTSSHSSASNPPLKSLPHRQRPTPIHLSSSVGSRNLFDRDIIGTHSLPETPRISSARRSDVEFHHMLSLQINKENIGATDDLSWNLATKTARRRDQVLKLRPELVDESTTPAGKYARQIVKQVKERVSRKVGLDITNTIRNRDQIKEREEDDADDDRVVLLKPKKSSKGCERAGDKSSQSKKSTLSSSPSLRKQNQAIPLGNAQPESGRVSLKQKSQEIALQNHPEKKKCKKIVASDTYRNSPVLLKKHSSVYLNKQEEAFVRSSSVTNRANLLDTKTKKTPLSSELLNTNVPSLFPVKKDPSSSSAAKFPLKLKQSQESDALSSKSSPSQLSSCLSPLVLTSYKHTPTVQDLISRYNSNYVLTNGGSGTEFQYITRILNRTGIFNNNSSLSSSSFSQSQWYSPSHPLNPSIFNHLEISFLCNFPITTAATTKEGSQLNHRCNRKLIFQLVDEILVEILKPYVNLKPWTRGSVRLNRSIHLSELVEKICTKIRSFPSADCSVLEDIDELIERDLGVSEVKLGSMALEEEGEAIVAELERDLVESLLHEMALLVMFGNRGSSDVGSRGYTR